MYRIWWDAADERLVANNYFLDREERGGRPALCWFREPAGWEYQGYAHTRDSVRYVVSSAGEALQLQLEAGQATLSFQGTEERHSCAIPFPQLIGEPAWDERRIWVPGYMGLYEIERKSGALRWVASQKDTQCLSVVRFGEKLCVATTKGLFSCPVPE